MSRKLKGTIKEVYSEEGTTDWRNTYAWFVVKILQNVQTLRKWHKQTAHTNFNESREEGDSAFNSAQSVNYNTTVTFNLELRSIPGCKKW